MTERVLPAIAIGARARPAHRDATPAERAIPAPGAVPAAAARGGVLLPTPARAGILLGASAAVYAITLAGVAGLQAHEDAATAAAREPLTGAVAASRAANDALETRLEAMDVQLAGLVEAYGTLGTDLAGYQARLDELASLVAEVEGSAAALPARIRLPAVSVRAPASGGGGSGRAAPRTSGRSGGSGG